MATSVGPPRRREMVKSQRRHIWNVTSVENPDLPHFTSNFTMAHAALPTLLLTKTSMWHGNMHVAWTRSPKSSRQAVVLQGEPCCATLDPSLDKALTSCLSTTCLYYSNSSTESIVWYSFLWTTTCAQDFLTIPSYLCPYINSILSMPIHQFQVCPSPWYLSIFFYWETIHQSTHSVFTD